MEWAVPVELEEWAIVMLKRIVLGSEELSTDYVSECVWGLGCDYIMNNISLTVVLTRTVKLNYRF